MVLDRWQQVIVGSLFGWRRLDGTRRFRTAYIEIARIDHWFKNAFMVLGVVLAAFYDPAVLSWSSAWPLVIAVAATCLVA